MDEVKRLGTEATKAHDSITIGYSLFLDDLKIQDKEPELESRKADVRAKNLQYIKELSGLMKDGIIENNNDIQIAINDMLLLGKTAEKVRFKNDISTGSQSV